MARLDRMGSLQGSPRVITALLDENVKSVYTVVSPIETAYRPAQSLLLRDTGLGLRGPDALHLATAARHDFMIHLFMPGF